MAANPPSDAKPTLEPGAGAAEAAFPPLPLREWRPTKETLHRWVQVVGKIRLAAAPPRNHWWHAPLYLSTRGLTTGPMPAPTQGDDRTFALDFDFLDHRLLVATNAGERDGFGLEDGLSVAGFHRRLVAILGALGLEVEIRPVPFDLRPPTPFAEDIGHAAYDPGFAHRWWLILSRIAPVFETFAGRFTGKTSPVHLFWHSFDLAVTRFSGRRAPDLGAVDPVTRAAYSHEVISFGFWAGDDRVPAPAFYSYTAPEPTGLTDEPLRPDAALWDDTGRGYQALLLYEEMRTTPDPRAALLDFFESAYQAGARTAGWDQAELAAETAKGSG